MNCSDFKEWIPERVSGELTPEKKQEMESHESSCSTCRQALAEWRQMESLLRSSWPVEDLRRSFFLPVPPRRSGWLETARTWFGLASMAAVTGCLLLLVLFRPAIHLDRGQLSVNFFSTSSESAGTAAQPITQAQVQGWVQDALSQSVSQTSSKANEIAPSKPVATSIEDADHVAQLAAQIQLLKENQLSLWQEVNQHGLYLQSSWRPASDRNDLYPKEHSNQP